MSSSENSSESDGITCNRRKKGFNNDHPLSSKHKQKRPDFLESNKRPKLIISVKYYLSYGTKREVVCKKKVFSTFMVLIKKKNSGKNFETFI